MSDSDFDEKMLSNLSLSDIVNFNLKEFDREMKAHIHSLRHLFTDNYEEIRPTFDRIISEMTINVISSMEAIAIETREASVTGTFDHMKLVNEMSDEEKMKYIDIDRNNYDVFINPSDTVSNYQKMKWEL